MKADQINLSTRDGAVSLIRHDHGRRRWVLEVEGYGEAASASFDDTEARRLVHFLLTGEALTTDQGPPPLPAWAQ